MLNAQEDLPKNIQLWLNMEVDSETDKEKWMVEVDVQQLASYSLVDKQYWIHVVEAAQQASIRAVELSEGVINEWEHIVKDRRFKHLPTSTPIPTERSINTEPASRRAKSPQTKKRRQSIAQLSTNWTAHKKQSEMRRTGVKQLTRPRERMVVYKGTRAKEPATLIEKRLTLT